MATVSAYYTTADGSQSISVFVGSAASITQLELRAFLLLYGFTNWVMTRGDNVTTSGDALTKRLWDQSASSDANVLAREDATEPSGGSFIAVRAHTEVEAPKHIFFSDPIVVAVPGSNYNSLHAYATGGNEWIECHYSLVWDEVA